MKKGVIINQGTIRRSKLFFLPFFLLLIFLISVFIGYSQESTPPIPNVFWGTASLNENPVSSGITIEAYIDGALAGSTTATSGGKYTIIVSGTTNNIVNFKICSLVASPAPTLNEGESTNLDLSATGTCPSGDSGPTGGPGGTSGTSTPTALQTSSLHTTDKESHFYDTLNPSKTTTFVIKDTKFAFRKISFNVSKLSNNVNITFSVLDKLPSYISSLRDVYQYIVVETENLDNNVKDVEIEFKVPKSWLDAKKYDKEKIALIRYYDGWSTLDTALTDEDNTYVYYRAQSPGFSIFAIKVLETVEHPAPDMTPPPLLEEQQEKVSESQEEFVKSSAGNIIFDVTVILIIILLILMIVAKVKTQGRKNK